MEYNRRMNDRDQARRISEANSAFRGFLLEAESTGRLVFRPVDLDERLSGHNDWLSNMATRPHAHFMLGRRRKPNRFNCAPVFPVFTMLGFLRLPNLPGWMLYNKTLNMAIKGDGAKERCPFPFPLGGLAGSPDVHDIWDRRFRNGGSHSRSGAVPRCRRGSHGRDG